ncbi:class I SAM-dependent methyltransferase [Actinoplanes sp. M2I2]|uniref:class I SAM-dependent methyltransferase n=1 Tax=Actinoplanes sp. M2I2 TaxID=1734444 RepID=UPI002021D74E|nr:class I SAM-dependent methyltransferase [Actinoplanes sp. M2I2]
MISSGYDAELRRHHEVLRRAWDIGPHDRVLDVGCGAGLTTRDAARAARDGSALGVDISGPAVELARELARAEGLGNVAFERADVQAHPFPPAGFDVAISRFGTMFFDDPVAAFGGVGRALRPGGRLVMLVWQAGELNEWHLVVRRALDRTGPSPNAFSLADPSTVRQVLGAAGFADVTLTDVDEPVCYGPDVAAALDWVRGFASVQESLTAVGVERLREELVAHATGDGVWLGSRAWLVTARRG